MQGFELFDLVDSCVFLCDTQGKFVSCNSYFTSLFGYTTEELIGQEVEMVLPIHLRKKHRDYLLNYFKNPVVREMGVARNIYGISKSGDKINLELGIKPIKREDGTLVILGQGLPSDKIHSRDFALKDMFSMMDEMFERLSRFSYHVAHEIRGPLVSLNAVIQKSTNIDSETIRETKKMLDKLTQEVSVVQGLLGLSQDQESTVDLASSISEIMLDSKVKWSLEFENIKDKSVRGELVCVLQTLIRLIYNLSNEDDNIELRLKSYSSPVRDQFDIEAIGNLSKVGIESTLDFGAEISFREKVISLDEILSLKRSLYNMLGIMEVRDLDQGVLLSLKFPRFLPSVEHSTYFNSILHVDDSEIDRMLVGKMLQKSFGRPISCAVNGKEALEMIKSMDPATLGDGLLVLLDINMPIMNGHGFCHEMEILKREDPMFSHVYVIMLSSSSEQADRVQAYRHDFVIDYWTKPLQNDQVKGLKHSYRRSG